ncbi:hypothetical protein E2C01_086215 [Portunus trituberculatus]|uniref:Uncharacterized protein n=1 Tax=Portunus trituberculatus TaxID=210409 RepID=A0A5B7JAX9_PORTR|nr:hypothetical protein [Portunus trituberculatus]
MRASEVNAHIDATSNFGGKMRIEKVRGNRKGAAVSCLRKLCFGEEKMRFGRGEVVFYRMKIRSKIANVAEVNEEKVEGGVKTFWVTTETAVRPEDISGPLSRRGLQGWIWSHNFEF